MEASNGVDQLANVSELKNAGNELFMRHQYELANSEYVNALLLLENILASERLQKKAPGVGMSDAERLSVICHSNQAQCLLNNGKPEQALAAAELALRIDQSNIKACYRRAIALEGVGRLDDSVTQLQELLRKEPTNAPAQKMLSRLCLEAKARQSAGLSPLAEAEKLMQLKIPTVELANRSASRLVHLMRLRPSEQKEVLQSGVLTHLDSVLDSVKYLRILAVLVENLSVDEAKQVFSSEFLSEKLSEWCRNLENNDWESLGAAGSAIVFLLSAISSDPYYDDSIRDQILKTMRVAMLNTRAPESFSESEIERALVLLKALSSIALNDVSSRPSIRRQFLETALLSHVGSVLELKQELVRFLAIVSRSSSNLETASDSKQPLHDPEFATLSENIVRPLVKAESVDSNSKGLVALSLLLHAIPPVGQSLVASDDILSIVVDIAAFGVSRQKSLAIEILAMASSNTAVRKAIAAADLAELFYDVLSSNNRLAASYACVALAKLCCADERVRERVLDTKIVLEKAVSLIRQDDGIIDPVPSTQALESILYLCSYKETKKDLVKSDDGAWLRTILEMVERPKNISRCGYAIAQIACSLVTSEDDLRIELDLDSDEEKLRKLASRGLPDSKEQEAALRLVGSVDDINPIRKVVVHNGIVRSLTALHSSKASAVSAETLAATVKALLRLASDRESCAFLVQQGAFKLLLRLRERSADTTNSKTKYDSGLAIARLAISTNPNLYPDSVLPSLPGVLLQVLGESAHELHDYECLLALTNIASTGAEICDQLNKQKAWTKVTSSLSSSNELVQVAALETLANLSYCSSGVDRLSSSAGDKDIEIFFLFANDSENERAQIASLSGLAMMSSDPTIAVKFDVPARLNLLQNLARSANPKVVERAQACISNIMNAR